MGWRRLSGIHGRPQEFLQRGAKPRGLTKMTYFSARRRRKRKILRFLRRFRLKYRVSIASAEGASENFRVFSTGTAYDVIIFKFKGGGQLPQVAPPLRAPMAALKVPVSCHHVVWLLERPSDCLRKLYYSTGSTHSLCSCTYALLYQLHIHVVIK